MIKAFVVNKSDLAYKLYTRFLISYIIDLFIKKSLLKLSKIQELLKHKSDCNSKKWIRINFPTFISQREMKKKY